MIPYISKLVLDEIELNVFSNPSYNSLLEILKMVSLIFNLEYISLNIISLISKGCFSQSSVMVATVSYEKIFQISSTSSYY